MSVITGLQRILGLAPPQSLEEWADERITEYNRQARKTGCRCGRPGTQVVYDNRTYGAVPSERWTCDEHVGIRAWSGSTALWEHPRPCPTGRVPMMAGPRGGRPDIFYCEHRDHEEER